ncbi:hypothetical protein Q3G72_016665 [Acer saccharum]|nr:hypothetical protein Q3G72_016665 [Acer saccharum]
MARKKIREYDSKRLLKEHFKRLCGRELPIKSAQVTESTDFNELAQKEPWLSSCKFAILPKERASYRKRLIAVLDELESLKPEFDRRVDELNRAHGGAQLLELDGTESTSYGAETSSLEWPAVNKRSYSSVDSKQPSSMAIQSSWRNNNNRTQVLSSNPMQIDKQFQKL